MGLGKEKGSSRINRYERQVTAIGFESLQKLAEVLDVPVAYLLADNAAMADGILALASIKNSQQADMALLLRSLSADPSFAKLLVEVLHLPDIDHERARLALLAVLGR